MKLLTRTSLRACDGTALDPQMAGAARTMAKAARSLRSAAPCQSVVFIPFLPRLCPALSPPSLHRLHVGGAKGASGATALFGL